MSELDMKSLQNFIGNRLWRKGGISYKEKVFSEVSSNQEQGIFNMSKIYTVGPL